MAQPDHTIEIRIIIELRLPQSELESEPEFDIAALRMPVQFIPVGEVLEFAAHRLEVPVEALLGRGRGAPLAQARQLAMLLAREKTGASYPEIGDALRRNHTTVLHGCRVTRRRLGYDPEVQRIWEALCVEFDRTFDGAEPNPRR